VYNKYSDSYEGDYKMFLEKANIGDLIKITEVQGVKSYSVGDLLVVEDIKSNGVYVEYDAFVPHGRYIILQ
jgi:hypothetical protein